MSHFKFEPNGIPQELKDLPRWAPWRAQWNEKRGKFDKIPHNPRTPKFNVSTAKPNQWASFDVALEAYNNSPDKFAGLGLCVTNLKGFVIFDLDNVLDDGKCADWASELIDGLRSYTEISPSGAGLRVAVRGSVPEDSINHDLGIEVYGGHAARFLTFTGDVLDGGLIYGNKVQQAPADVLERLVNTHKRTKAATTANDLPIPDILDQIPSLDGLGLSAAVKSFLANGEAEDRSKMLFRAGIELQKAGLNEQETLTVLVSNPNTFDVALSHRDQDDVRATQYLWQNHVLKAKEKAGPPATLDDFDDISEIFAYSISKLIPVEFVVDGFISTGVTTIAGAPGVGKTSLLVPLAAAVAHLYPSSLNPQLRRIVIYLAESPEQVQRSLYGLSKATNTASDSEFNHWFKIIPSKRSDAKAIGCKVRKLVEEHSVDQEGYTVGPLIVLDTSNANIDLSNENDNAEVGKAMAAIKENIGNAACWVVTHTPKALKRADVKDLTSRGGGAFEGDVSQTAFIFAEECIKDKRFMSLGKKRFEPDYYEVEFKTSSDSEIVPTPWGGQQTIRYRFGVPEPSSSAEREQQKEAAKTQKDELKVPAVLDLIHREGPQSKKSLKEVIGGNGKSAQAMIDRLIENGTLIESEEHRGGHPLWQIGNRSEQVTEETTDLLVA